YVLMFNTHLYYGASADTLFEDIQLIEKCVNDHLQDDPLIRIRLYWIYALYYNNVSQPDAEMEAYIKALEISRSHGVGGATEGALLDNIGGILLKQGKYDEAEVYFKESLTYTKDAIGRGVSSHNLGQVYNGKKEYDTALGYFRESFRYHQEGKDIKGMVEALVSEAEYYDRKQDFRRANELYLRGLDLVEENDIGGVRPTIFTSIAKHHFQRRNFQAAINYAEKARVESQVQQNYSMLSETYPVLHDSYAAVGDFRKAYDILAEQMAYQDSVSNSELLTKVEALKTEFEVEQKEKENKLLKAEAEADQQTIRSRGIAAIALLLGLLLLSSWAVVIYRSNRRKQRYNDQLEATVTERTLKLKQANENLAQANQDLKTFNYIASHDIKEPIRNIGSYAGLIFRKLPEALQTDYQSYFDNIKRSTGQLYTLVEDFSKYTQLSEGEAIDVQVVDLNEVMENVKLGLNEVRQEKNGVIQHQSLPPVQTNSSLIYTMLKNLIENGLKFNESEQPMVSIYAKDRTRFTEIVIEDNGIGIESQYHEQIFETFKRLHQRHEYKGSGIGLAIVKLLSNKLGANIQLDSEPGQGSRFVLQLPKA
ncbi:MAG: ATP-binding protein, partial [Bacteroidota bacterium]